MIHAPLFFEWPEYGGLPMITRISRSLTFCAALTSALIAGQQKVRLRLDRLQRVGQKHLQPLVVVQRMPLVAEILRQLQVRDRVGRDQVFEAEQVFQDVLAHDQVGAPGVRPADIVENALEHLQQERAGAAGEVEHRDAVVVGEALGESRSCLSECRPPRGR